MLDTTVNIMPLVMVALTTIGVPLATYFLKLGVSELCRLLAPYIGEKQMLVVQQRLDALLDKGIGEAALFYLPQLQAKGLTVDTGNLIAARVADYAVNHAPDLSKQAAAFEGSLQEKITARLITHPAIAAAVASGALAASPAAVPAAA